MEPTFFQFYNRIAIFRSTKPGCRKCQKHYANNLQTETVVHQVACFIQLPWEQCCLEILLSSPNSKDNNMDELGKGNIGADGKER